jgi:hypothetical protein
MDLQELNELVENAIERFLSNDAESVARFSDQAQQIAPNTTAAVYLNCLVREMRGDCADIARMLNDGDISHLHLMHKVCHLFLDGERRDSLETLANITSGRVLSFLPLYYLACFNLTKGHLDEGWRVLEQFQARLPLAFQVYGIQTFIENPELSVVLRQGRLCVGNDEIVERLAQWNLTPSISPEISVVQKIESESRTYVCACNGIYFDAMGEKFIGSVLALDDSAVHVHVVEPTADTLSFPWVETVLSSGRVGISTEPPPSIISTTYYACSRFFVMPFLLDLYERPLVSLDIDIQINDPAFNAHQFADDYDFCCFITERNEPASVMQASIMVWPDRDTTRRYCQELQAYCAAELGNPSIVTWLLDQAALFCVKEVCVTGKPIRFGNLTELVNGRLEAHVSEITDDDTRHILKNAVYPEEPKEIKI